MSLRLRIAFSSILVGLLVLGLKLVAYWWTGSVALYSDALESVVNVASAIAAFLAVWFAAKPATVKVKVRPLKKLKDAAL